MPGEVPGGWQAAPVSSLIASDLPGFWGDEPDGISPPVKVLRSTNFTDGGRLDLDDIAERVFPDRVRQTKRLRHGDLLLERSGGGPNKPVGRVCLFEEEGEYFYSNFIQGLRCRPDVDNRFVFYLLWHLHSGGTTRQLQQATTGIRNLAYNDYLAWSLLVPPIAEQKKIAAILASMDEAIQATQAVIDQTRRVKQGLLQDLLTCGLPGHTCFKQTEIGEIPESWEAPLLDEVSVRGSGHTPDKKHPEYWGGDITWVSLSDSHRLDNVFISETTSCISPAGVANSSAVVHPVGTVIVSRDASVGRSAIAACDLAVSQHFMAWRCGPRLDNRFLYYFLQRHKPRFEQIAAGSTIKTIGLGYFKKLRLPLPEIGEQRRIAERLFAMDEALWAHERDLGSLSNAKAGLLQDLLTGRVRVTP